MWDTISRFATGLQLIFMASGVAKLEQRLDQSLIRAINVVKGKRLTKQAPFVRVRITPPLKFSQSLAREA